MILSQDGTVSYHPQFLSQEQADEYLSILGQEIAWRSDTIQLFGKTFLQPRLLAWYGEPEAIYTYSKRQQIPLPWTASLLALRQKLEDFTQCRFNSVLLNRYRNGQDSMGWHADNEPELGPQPCIASLSLGCARLIQFRHKVHKNLKTQVCLEHGSLLLMRGQTQSHWQHQIPKSKRIENERINLTFRWIYT
jgi:alkylated DNA repair dioxygenase AlkB